MPKLDSEQIERFIREEIGNKLKDFCIFQQRRIEKADEKRHGELSYDDLEGSNPSRKAQSLVILMEQGGYLPDLVLYLTLWWFEKAKDPETALRKYGFEQSLCLAAQELWQQNHSEQGLEAFVQLAMISADFAAIWEPNDLQEDVWFEPIRDYIEFLEHLKTCRKLYETAADDLKKHALLAARQNFLALVDLQSGYRDASEWKQRLGKLEDVTCLQNVIDASRLGFIYDQRLPWGANFPYLLFQQLGIPLAPTSSMEQIQAELRQIADLPEETRVRLETLGKSETERLFVDVFLYPELLSFETALKIEADFFQVGQLPTSEEIKVAYPGAAGVLLFLLGERGESAAYWKTVQMERPLEGRLAHCQALLFLGEANTAAQKADEKILAAWKKTIAQWAMVIPDITYWVVWGQARSKTYGRDFVYQAISNLCNSLQDYLIHLLAETRSKAAQEGRGSLAAELGHLQQDLLTEFAAARLIHALGSVSLGAGKKARFGPLGMSYLGLDEQLSEYLATENPENQASMNLPDGLSAEEVLQRLRWYFSELRVTSAVLENFQSDLYEAKGMLQVDCGIADCPRHGQSSLPFWVPCPYSESFALGNPAYRRISAPAALLREDALQLALQIYLKKLHWEIDQGTKAKIDSFQGLWQNLSTLLKYTHKPAEIQKRIETFLIAESESVNESRLNSLIALFEVSLDMSSQFPQSSQNHLLKARLASLLTDRALLRTGNGDISGSEADLKRALVLAPHNHFIRRSLATVWCNQAGTVVYEDTYQSKEYLRRASELIEEGQRLYPGYDYSETLKWITDLRERLEGKRSGQPIVTPGTGTLTDPNQLYGRGMAELMAVHPENALKFFDQALKLTPEDAIIQEKAAQALGSHVIYLMEIGKGIEGKHLMESWETRLTSQSVQIEHQKEFFKWWLELRKWLKSHTEELPYYIVDNSIVHLQLSTAPVDLRIKGDDLCISAVLPIVSGSDYSVVVENLLKTSREIPLFKVAPYKEKGLQLVGVVPMRLLSASLLLFLTYEIADLASMSMEQLCQAEKMLNWFRETRAKYDQVIAPKEWMSVAGKNIERVCQERKLAFNRLTYVEYEITAMFGDVHMEAWSDGVRLETQIQRLQTGSESASLFQRFIELNSVFDWSKLALNNDMQVLLSVESPYLDYQAAKETFELLETKARQLQKDLDSQEE